MRTRIAMMAGITAGHHGSVNVSPRRLSHWGRCAAASQATARLSVTTGDGASWANASYKATMRG
jgi:hypothetical protein